MCSEQQEINECGNCLSRYPIYKKKSFPFRNDNEYGYLVYHLLIEYIESITLCHEIQNIIKCDNYKDEK